MDGLIFLKSLLHITSIESESFDFKQKVSDLQIHLCAFANTVGGYIILGIDENKTPSNHLLGFVLNGFQDGDQDNIKNEIGNAMYNVDPIPIVRAHVLDDTVNKKFYVVLKIEVSETNRPHCVKGSVKGSGMFYVRVGTQTAPASRTIIFNLFSNLAQRKHDIQQLKTSAKLMKESIRFKSEEIEELDIHDVIKRIGLLDLEFFRNIVLSTDWFFIDNQLYGGHVNDYSIQGGGLYNS